jgi:hypothetical protein
MLRSLPVECEATTRNCTRRAKDHYHYEYCTTSRRNLRRTISWFRIHLFQKKTINHIRQHLPPQSTYRARITLGASAYTFHVQQESGLTFLPILARVDESGAKNTKKTILQSILIYSLLVFLYAWFSSSDRS